MLFRSIDGAGGGSRVEIMPLGTAAVLDDDTLITATFDLDGDDDNDVIGSFSIVAVLPGVTVSDAWELSKRIDGTSSSTTAGTVTTVVGLSAPDAATADARGRVKYALPGTGETTTIVYVYLTHR